TRWPRDWSSDVCSSDLGDAHAALGILDLGLALEGRRLLADFLFLFERGDSNGLLALRLAHADLAQLAGIGDLNGLLTFGLGNARSEERRVGKGCRVRRG